MRWGIIITLMVISALWVNSYFIEDTKQLKYLESIDQVVVDENMGYEHWHEIEEPDGITIEFLIWREAMIRKEGIK